MVSSRPSLRTVPPWDARGLFQARLGETLRRIQESLEMDDGAWQQLLQISSLEQLRIASGESSWSVASLQHLCDTLEISIHQLLLGEVDIEQIRTRWLENRHALPERYSNPGQQRSRVRAVRVVTDYLDACHGTRFTGLILRRLQVSRVLLGDLDARISSQLTEDILRELKQEGFDPRRFALMGTFNFSVARQTGLARALSATSSARELYIRAFDELGDLLDEVCRYRLLSITDEEATMSVTIRPEASQAFHRPLVGTKENCLFRQGVALSLLGFQNGRFATLRESQCLYEGASRCRYNLSFPARGGPHGR